MAASKGLQKTASDFYVGGRNFGLLTVTATQMASAFGGGMMVAYVSISTGLVFTFVPAIYYADYCSGSGETEKT